MAGVIRTVPISLGRPVVCLTRESRGASEQWLARSPLGVDHAFGRADSFTANRTRR
jgi:hypothetical protein